MRDLKCSSGENCPAPHGGRRVGQSISGSAYTPRPQTKAVLSSRPHPRCETYPSELGFCLPRPRGCRPDSFVKPSSPSGHALKMPQAVILQFLKRSYLTRQLSLSLSGMRFIPHDFTRVRRQRVRQLHLVVENGFQEFTPARNRDDSCVLQQD